uniref:AlNc14C73G4964 protein n=1 Tax=Albugo laibachii Nc14 TaxID=890382 RepID=F0WEA7_9STRA|nr:AlNc14C73G4964 [Albugo laibachii Nc14]|eukprot:CCA19538.1 AlNc14C73G4964 [Albugo laibachii Nc14]
MNVVTNETIIEIVVAIPKAWWSGDKRQRQSFLVSLIIVIDAPIRKCCSWEEYFSDGTDQMDGNNPTTSGSILRYFERAKTFQKRDILSTSLAVNVPQRVCRIMVYATVPPAMVEPTQDGSRH